MSFVDIFVQVFDCLDAYRNLDVDVAVVFEKKERAVRYNMTIVVGSGSLEEDTVVFRTLVGWV